MLRIRFVRVSVARELENGIVTFASTAPADVRPCDGLAVFDRALAPDEIAFLAAETLR